MKFNTSQVNVYACVLKLIDKPLDEVFNWRAELMNKMFDPELAIQNIKQILNALICDALLDQDWRA